MATKKTTSEAQAEKAVVAESLYNVEELAEHASSVFGANIRSECVVAAFRHAGKTTAAVAQAKEIVNEFMKKEVK